jgi:hypothetical protein
MSNNSVKFRGNYFPDGGTAQPQPQPKPLKFGQVRRTLVPLSTQEKRDYGAKVLGVSGIDDELTTNGNVFDLYKEVVEKNDKLPPAFDLGKYEKLGYFKQEYDAARGGYRIYNTDKFMYGKDPYRTAMEYITSLPSNKGKVFLDSYGYKPKMGLGGIQHTFRLANSQTLRDLKGDYGSGEGITGDSVNITQKSYKGFNYDNVGGVLASLGTSSGIPTYSYEAPLAEKPAYAFMIDKNSGAEDYNRYNSWNDHEQMPLNFYGETPAYFTDKRDLRNRFKSYVKEANDLKTPYRRELRQVRKQPFESEYSNGFDNFNNSLKQTWEGEIYPDLNKTSEDFFKTNPAPMVGSYSQYDENGDPNTVWKGTDETEYGVMQRAEKERQEKANDPNRPDRYDQFGTLLNIAGADTNLEGAMFQLGRSLNFNSEKFAPEYQGLAKAGNITAGLGALGKVILGSVRNVNAGMGYQNRLQNFKEWYDKKESERAKGHYQTAEDGGLIYLSKGGEVPKEKLMSGDYTTGVGPRMPANAEVEHGEYLQHNDGSVQKVLGKTHEEGGEPMMLDAGTRVVSDNLKIGKELSKEVNEFFGLKSKPTDTYATIIDRYKKKNDIDDVEKREQEVLKKVEKNENVKNATAKTLNSEYLNEQLHQIQDEKLGLQEKLSQFTDFVFKAQQEAKGEPVEAQVPPEQTQPSPEEIEMLQQQAAMQQGADSVAQQEGVMRDGGIFEDERFKELLKNTDLDEERARQLYEIYQNGGYAGLPIFADGGGKPKRDTEYFSPTKILEEAQSSPEAAAYWANFFRYTNVNKYALIDRDRQHFNKDSGVYGGIEESYQDRLKWYYDNDNDMRKYIEKTDKGFALKKGYTVLNFQRAYQEKLEKQAKRLQSKGYFKDKEVEDVMKYLAFMDKQDTARGFDGKMGDFTSSRSFLAIPILKDENELKIASENGINSLKQLVEREADLEKLGISKESLQRAKDELQENGDLDLGLTYLDPVTGEPAPPAEPEPPTKEKGKPVTFDDDPEKRRRAIGSLSGLLFPDQTPLTPDGVTAHLMVDRNYERLDPIKVSYEPQMVESQRVYNAAADNIASLPETQRAAVLANMMASTQQGLNNVIGQTALANQQNEMQTEQFNIQQSNNEENARAEDLLSFEQRQLMAWENTLRDYNDWFEKVQQNRMLERQTENQVALLNQLNEHYKYDINGKLVAVDNGERFTLNKTNVPATTKAEAEVEKKMSEKELAEAKAVSEQAKNINYLTKKFNVKR